MLRPSPNHGTQRLPNDEMMMMMNEGWIRQVSAALLNNWTEGHIRPGCRVVRAYWGRYSPDEAPFPEHYFTTSAQNIV